MLNYSEKDIDALIKGVYDGDITPHDLPEDLYKEIAELLKKGLYKGFGSTLEDLTPGGTDFELLAELRENIYMFSGAKTYQQISDMVDLLSGDKVTEFKEFKEGANAIFDTYNKTWLETEYNTAIGMAQSAVKWDQIEAEKDVLKVLRYSTTENACDICGPLEGFTAPVEDPAWDSIMPPNHFNCLCLVEQLEEGSTTKNHSDVVKESEEKMNDVFKMNPGKDKVIFSEEHPYFSVDKKDKGFAEKNFGLPIPEDDE